MTAAPFENCPNCDAPLVIEHTNARTAIICANCRHQFVHGAVVDDKKTSGKAIASLVLGLGAMFAMCFTGIPAIVLGILALRDIHPALQKSRMVGFAEPLPTLQPQFTEDRPAETLLVRIPAIREPLLSHIRARRNHQQGTAPTAERRCGVSIPGRCCLRLFRVR